MAKVVLVDRLLEAIREKSRMMEGSLTPENEYAVGFHTGMIMIGKLADDVSLEVDDRLILRSLLEQYGEPYRRIVKVRKVVKKHGTETEH